MSRIQKEEIKKLFPNLKGNGELDYVCGWYKKAIDYIANTDIQCCFVSTNSICQGNSVITFWRYLIEKSNVQINFAYKSFIWDSEATDKAKVHCVIIGFSRINNVKNKYLFNNLGEVQKCKYINPYLSTFELFFIESRNKPLCKVSEMRFGSMPRDGGNLIITSEEKDEFIKRNPLSIKWIKSYIGAVEMLNNKQRYCLWLVDTDPAELVKCPDVMDRIKKVKHFRESSKAEGTRKYAKYPHLFCQIAQPDSDYIMLPKTSSGKRKYLPLDFKTKDTIASDLVFLIPDAGLLEFGILMSNIHNIWMRTVAGRLKSDYRYSKDIVYNNFPWCQLTDESKANIEDTANKILKARQLYPNNSLSEMYGENMYLYSELVKAHNENDKAVMKAYGFKRSMSDDEIITELMKMYQNLITKNQ